MVHRLLPRRRVLQLAALIAAMAMVLVLVACGSTSPAPAAPQPTTPQAKAADSAKAPVPTIAIAVPAATAQPTSPPKAVDFPAKGKSVTYIAPFGAGAGDTGARVVASLMEKELGIPVQVVNKPDAGGQVGLTTLAMAKPDGYTLGATHLPTHLTIYLDPARKATFDRGSFVPVAGYVVDPFVVAVKAGSPYKSVKDLIDAAKASPEKVIMASSTGKLSAAHMGILLLEKVADVKFATVLTNGGAEAVAALLGGHANAAVGSGGVFMPQVKSGDLRILGVMDEMESPFLPGVKTLQSQGYNVNMAAQMGASVPKDTPKEIVNILTGSIKKAMDTGELKQRMDSMGMQTRFMDGTQYAARWADVENQVKPLVSLAKQ